MNVPPKSRDGIFTSRPLEWNFQCSYDSSYDLTADEISMDASAKTGDFSGTGQFDIDMRKVSYIATRKLSIYYVRVFYIAEKLDGESFEHTETYKAFMPMVISMMMNCKRVLIKLASLYFSEVSYLKNHSLW